MPTSGSYPPNTWYIFKNILNYNFHPFYIYLHERPNLENVDKYTLFIKINIVIIIDI